MSQKTEAADKLFADLIAAGYPPEPEHVFHPSRKWRFDMAYPQVRLAIEVDGRGRHQSPGGYAKDCQKINAAIEMGWRVIRYPTSYVETHKRRARMVEQITRILLGVEDADEAGFVLVGDA